MMDLNGLYATHRNVTPRHTGRVWQGRFYSAVLDPALGATALRSTELNPVRARMVARAEDWAWRHAGVARQARVCAKLTQREAAALRLATRHDTAFGSPEFFHFICQDNLGTSGYFLPVTPVRRKLPLWN